MSSAWAYQLLIGETREEEKKLLKEKYNEYRKTCRLVLKAIELIPVFGDEIKKKEKETTEKVNYNFNKEMLNKSGVLSGPYILHRVKKLPISDPSHLDITPFDPKDVQGASIDLHLGNWFVILRRVKLQAVNVKRDEKLLKTIGREKVFVPNGKPFTIHPNDFVLGSSLEFLALPSDLMAFVEGKSSLGRFGLIVATASQVAPGFHGVIVLELTNTGTVPMEIIAGEEIAQLVLQTMTEPVPEEYKYHKQSYCQIEP